ncbi:ATP-binding protein [Candidatus Palauibacter sp.]|uniref:ATP-binding protein n=1 Tax=Candidatus Palauibacter sp. TaxID=3101350 RepID=UPI003C6ED00D
MIQIESVTIRELRGIRELAVQPRRNNFVVSGPNGSGKSGVVDAVQFALTGEMSRLAGKGTGGLTVNRHGPHVDHRDDPASAEVSIRFYVPDLEKSAILTRNVKNAKKFKLEPDEPEIRAIIEKVAGHPELSLSRREIIKYIIVEAGQRSKEIQALLKLEAIGQTRGVLKTTSNKLAIVVRQAQNAVTNADEALCRHLDATALTQESVLAAINLRWSQFFGQVVKVDSRTEQEAPRWPGRDDGSRRSSRRGWRWRRCASTTACRRSPGGTSFIRTR